MTYLLLKAHRAEELNEQVNKHLRLGWNLYGTPLSNSDSESTILCQAVVREGNELVTSVLTPEQRKILYDLVYQWRERNYGYSSVEMMDVVDKYKYTDILRILAAE